MRSTAPVTVHNWEREGAMDEGKMSEEGRRGGEVR